jgi:hypothetical protein
MSIIEISTHINDQLAAELAGRSPVPFHAAAGLVTA